MIVHVAEDGAVALREESDFKGFKIAVAKPGASAEFIARALAGVAKPEPDGKTAWVSQAWLKRGRPSDWTASFDRMVESVRRFGWVRDQDSSVRAHIEVAAAS